MSRTFEMVSLWPPPPPLLLLLLVLVTFENRELLVKCKYRKNIETENALDLYIEKYEKFHCFWDQPKSRWFGMGIILSEAHKLFYQRKIFNRVILHIFFPIYKQIFVVRWFPNTYGNI